MSVKISTLPSGLRVVSEEVRAVDSVALGVWAAVGTRHENMAHNGVAHMVEHMMFKGTPSRNAQDIATEMENVGAHMNAYTSREITSYHVHLLKENMSLGMDVISDMIQHSSLPENELERERQVVLQEIGMTHDTPDDYIFDMYQCAAYSDQALGLPILGDPSIVSSMKSDVLRSYINNNYSPRNLVVSSSGNISHDEVVAMAEKMFTDLPVGAENLDVKPASYTGGDARIERDLEQAHVVLGFHGVSKFSPDYQSASVLTTLFGGGMSSRLFQEIREKRGLVYSIFCVHSSYKDDGQLEIYAGTGPDSLGELIPVLCDEIVKLSSTITEEELTRAKSQRKASLLMSRESMMRRADRNAKSVIYDNEPFNVEAELENLDKVTLDSLGKLASEIFASKLTLAALGPLGELEEYDSICKRLAS